MAAMSGFDGKEFLIGVACALFALFVTPHFNSGWAVNLAVTFSILGIGLMYDAIPLIGPSNPLYEIERREEEGMRS